MRITDISLVDIMKKYLRTADFIREGTSGRYKTVCPFHEDTAPSLILYDKTEEGQGWDYHCFSCGAHGVAPTMLTSLAIAQTEEQALDILCRDFDLKLPDKVTLEEFAKFKGLSAEFLKTNGWTDSPQGLEIPYFDLRQNLIATKVRTKYQGKDKYIYRSADGQAAVHTTPYGLHWLDAYDDSVIYIAEGETDCITLRQAGYQAIGFASAYGYRPEFNIYLKRFAAIVILKDNDEPGWRLVTDIAANFPEKVYMITLPKGIKDINNFHQYRCRADISHFKKMFPDMAMIPASPETFIRAVAAKELEPTERGCWEMVMRYYKDIPEQLHFKERFARETGAGKALITASMKAVHKPIDPLKSTGEFTIQDNCYYAKHMAGAVPIDVKISNFTLVPEYDIRSDEDIIRVCTLTNQYGEVKHGVRFTSEDMTAVTRFNIRLVSSGNYIFTGNVEELFKLCVMIFERSKKVVHSPKRIGRLDTGGWLFGNMGIDKAGCVHKLEHGVVTLDGKSYAPRSIVIEDGDSSDTSDLPTFSTKGYRKVCGKRFLRRSAEAFKGTFGTYGSYLALGWTVAGWFSNQVFDEYGFYPYLFISGKRSSGKSVMSNMLQATYGFSASGAGMSIETPSNIGILRYLGYRASLPSWYDDYRSGVKRIQMKDGLLLDVYNRHGSVKGVNNASGEVRSESVNGFVLLSGEDTPSNNALLTRCVVVQLSATERDASKFADATLAMQQLRMKALQWAKQATRGASILASIKQVEAVIFKRSGEIRYAQNTAIFAGAFLWAYGSALPKSEVDAFIDYLASHAYAEKVSIDSMHPMAQFFHDFPDMIAKGHIVRGRDFAVVDANNVAIRLNTCHKGWCDYHKDDKMQEKTLRDYIKKEAFYLTEDRIRFEEAGRLRAIVVKGLTMQEEFEDFYEVVIEREASKY